MTAVKPPRPLDPVAVTTVVEKIVAEWLCNGTSHTSARCHINMGPCADFAEEVVDALAEEIGDDVPAAVMDSIDMDQLGWTVPTNEYHAFVVIAGVYYDAEAPNGVDNPLELPFFQERSWHREFYEAEESGGSVGPGVEEASKAHGWLPPFQERHSRIAETMRADLDAWRVRLKDRLPALESDLEDSLRLRLEDRPNLREGQYDLVSQAVDKAAGAIIERETAGLGIGRAQGVEMLMAALSPRRDSLVREIRDGTFVAEMPMP